MGDYDHYDYSVDKNDALDTIDFGKFQGATPKEVLKQKPSYIILAWENTNKWVGSEDLVKTAYKNCGKRMKDREYKPDVSYEPESTEAFEEAVLVAYGCTPIKAKHTKEENHNEY